MDIIGKKNLYFLISALVIIPGLLSLLFFGLHFGIDFTGGSELQITSQKSISVSDIKKYLTEEKISFNNTKQIGDKEVLIRTSPLDQNQKNTILSKLQSKDKTIKEDSFETVGPVVGGETKANAVKGVLIASIVITLFIAFAFREVSKPVSSWKFGVCAIIALLHDLLVVVGVFSILGKLFAVEVDTLFITALLTVMGFSVHDTIVVFDRIRENLKKSHGIPFEKVVNASILETFNRSLNTSLTVVIVLFILLLFSGDAIRWFVVALLVGVISGTYSSIFNASPLLVLWNEWDKKSSKIKV